MLYTYSLTQIIARRDISTTLVPRATLRGVAELHVASGMPQWRMLVTSSYI